MITNIDSNIKCNFSLMGMLILCANLSHAVASLTLAQCQLIITRFMAPCIKMIEYNLLCITIYIHSHILTFFYCHYMSMHIL